uniref:Uncharacterized protein n=1 Tax=Rhizophora mucronata TaxID=61149 RepID=A0A2P2MZZ6_RHIMU
MLWTNFTSPNFTKPSSLFKKRLSIL